MRDEQNRTMGASVACLREVGSSIMPISLVNLSVGASRRPVLWVIGKSEEYGSGPEGPSLYHIHTQNSQRGAQNLQDEKQTLSHGRQKHLTCHLLNEPNAAPKDSPHTQLCNLFGDAHPAVRLECDLSSSFP